MAIFSEHQHCDDLQMFREHKLPDYSTERFYSLSVLEEHATLVYLPLSSSPKTESANLSVLYLLHHHSKTIAKPPNSLLSTIRSLKPTHICIEYLSLSLIDHKTLVNAAKAYSSLLSSSLPSLNTSITSGVTTHASVAPCLAHLSTFLTATASPPLTIYALRSDLLGFDHLQETDAVQGSPQTLLHLGRPALTELSFPAQESKQGRVSADRTANALIAALVLAAVYYAAISASG